MPASWKTMIVFLWGFPNQCSQGHLVYIHELPLFHRVGNQFHFWKHQKGYLLGINFYRTQIIYQKDSSS